MFLNFVIILSMMLRFLAWSSVHPNCFDLHNIYQCYYPVLIQRAYDWVDEIICDFRKIMLKLSCEWLSGINIITYVGIVQSERFSLFSAFILQSGYYNEGFMINRFSFHQLLVYGLAVKWLWILFSQNFYIVRFVDSTIKRKSISNLGQ